MDPSDSDTTEQPVVLVVDDDPAVTRMLSIVLLRLDVQVVATNHAFGVLNLIAEHRPRLVVLDVMMPGIDGATIATLVREDPDLAGTRVVLYSALDESSLSEKATACGADGWVSKGQAIDETIRRLGRFVRPPTVV